VTLALYEELTIALQKVNYMRCVISLMQCSKKTRFDKYFVWGSWFCATLVRSSATLLGTAIRRHQSHHVNLLFFA